MHVPFRYRDLHPDTIRFTSEHLDFDGFLVQIRDLPEEGEGATDRRGLDCFAFGYRPLPDKSRSSVRFDHAPGHPLPMNRIKLVLAPERPCRWSWQNAAGRVAAFGLHPAFVEAVLGRAGLPARGLWAFPPAAFVINHPVEGLCRLLMDETEQGCPHGRPYFEHLGAALVIAIGSQTDPRLPEAGNLEAQHRRLQPALALMQADFGAKLTLGQLARATGLSAFHFSRLFHAVIGLTPCRCLWAYRLHRARLLLSVAAEAPSIGEVAAACGFADQAHLCRRFRQAYGVSPLAFRRAQSQTASRFKKRLSAP
jgi:AraC-like DNA-binding protein